ncbi:MAG: FtsW/RodA/SpoVE family cell cycle protein, partial [Patescibacteria group bacterium]
MSRVETKQIDKTFLLLVGGVTLLGLIVLASASTPTGFERFGDSHYFLKHQIFLGLIPGIIAFVITFTVPYTFWRTYAFPMLLISILLLVLVFIPGIGQDFGTFANSWVAFGSFSFQPAEIVKLTFLLYLAAWMDKRGEQLRGFQSGLVPFLVILGVIAFLMLMQPDLGTLAIIAAMSLIIYFVAGAPILYLFGLGGVGAVLFGIAIKLS